MARGFLKQMSEAGEGLLLGVVSLLLGVSIELYRHKVTWSQGEGIGRE